MNIEHINKRVEEHYQFLIEQGYKPNNIIGVFAYSSMNYNTYVDGISDVDVIALIIPTFEELCLKKNLSVQLQNGEEHIDVKDINNFNIQLQKGSINYLEILFTPFFKLNKKYENIFQDLYINQRDEICRNAYRDTVNRARGRFNMYLGKKNITNKDIANLFFLKNFITTYERTENFKESLRFPFDSTDFTNPSLRLKLAKPLDAKEIETIILFNFKAYTDKDFKSTKQITFTPIDFEQMTIKMIEIGIYNLPQQKKKSDFNKSLTLAETDAFNLIKEKVNEEEGHISISHLLLESNLSRPVFKRTLEKMQEYQIAEVISRGVKGTFIKFI